MSATTYSTAIDHTAPELGEPIAVRPEANSSLPKSLRYARGIVVRLNDSTVTILTYGERKQLRIPRHAIDRDTVRTSSDRGGNEWSEPYADTIAACREMRPELWAEVDELVGEPTELEDGDVVVIACGGRKTDEPAPAAELYTGSYFAAALRAARALVPDERILILSGRYGLLRTTDVVAPYEQRIDAPGAVGWPAVTAQADELGLRGRRVTALTGKAYGEVLAGALVDVELEVPLEDAGGIGDHLATFKRIAEAPAEPEQLSLLAA